MTSLALHDKPPQDEHGQGHAADIYSCKHSISYEPVCHRLVHYQSG